jgi:NADPH:quinone reductase-like Zn-dependent oxidoreductase
MRAAVRTEYGPPEVVQMAEVAKPTPRDNEVLVRVHAATVNRTDCGFRSGKPFIVRFFSGLHGPKAKVLGSEFAGEIEAIGGDVTSFHVGDRVFGYDDSSFGAHAEYMTVPENGLMATIPADLAYEEVAPSTEGSHYALSFIRAAGIRQGQDVLVHGATGAIGSAAVQLLKSLGANVTAVCRRDHVDLVGGLGADRVIDSTAEDFTMDVQAYDAVIDAVGKSSFGRCKRLLKPRGIFLSSDLGPLSQNPFLAIVTPLFGGRKVVFPFPRGDPSMATYFKGLLESGAFKPVIDRRYPLEEIVEAYRYVETGQKIGNVVIRVAADRSVRRNDGSED